MDNKGEQLNQLSRLLFGSAANCYYFSILLEIIAILFSIIGDLLNPGDLGNLIFAIICFGILVISYFLKLQARNQYENAETMRRQSVLSEALDWPMSRTQFTVWKNKAGGSILEKWRVTKRPQNYYQTKETLGAKKLLEMTCESTFYTRCLYQNLRSAIWKIGFPFILIILLVFGALIPTGTIPNDNVFIISYAIYLLLPMALSLDLFGIWNKLNSTINEIVSIEESLERISNAQDINKEFPEIMRLVAEYNCLMVNGIPIPDFLFHLWHDSISKLWSER